VSQPTENFLKKLRMAQKRYLWKIIVVFSTMLFVINSIAFIRLGRVNADEGWYLYASKLVYAGQSPYRDFAYTQTPLLPYIYGIAQNLFSPSIYLGRVTSVLFSLAAFILALLISKNYAGEMASGIASLLGATFTFGIFFQTIVKTYALTTFFFMLAFFVLTTSFRKDIKLVLSIIFVLLAVLTRLSAAFFAIPFLFYALIVSNTKIRVIILGLCFLAVGWILILAWPNLGDAKWALITHHTSQWGHLSIVERASRIVSVRIPRLWAAFYPYFILWAVLLFLGFSQIRHYIKRYLAVSIALAGTCLFAIPNLLSGAFYTDYLAPFVFVLFPISAIAYTKLFPRQGKFPQIMMTMALFFPLVFGLMDGKNYIDTSGAVAPVEKIIKVSTIIKENSTHQDQIFVLEALWLVVEADRQALPDMTMAQFSFYDTDTKAANHLHLVNGEIAWNYIRRSIPKIVILTDTDWELFRQQSSYYKNIRDSLKNNYRLLSSEADFGQYGGTVEIYVRSVNQ
jgi:hypothetical protein